MSNGAYSLAAQCSQLQAWQGRANRDAADLAESIGRSLYRSLSSEVAVGFFWDFAEDYAEGVAHKVVEAFAGSLEQCRQETVDTRIPEVLAICPDCAPESRIANAHARQEMRALEQTVDSQAFLMAAKKAKPGALTVLLAPNPTSGRWGERCEEQGERFVTAIDKAWESQAEKIARSLAVAMDRILDAYAQGLRHIEQKTLPVTV